MNTRSVLWESAAKQRLEFIGNHLDCGSGFLYNRGYDPAGPVRPHEGGMHHAQTGESQGGAGGSREKDPRQGEARAGGGRLRTVRRRRVEHGGDPEKVIAAYVAEGHRESSVKRLRLYIKPEDRKAYYVVNEKVSGSVDL